MGLSDRYIGSCEFSKNSINDTTSKRENSRSNYLHLEVFITFLFIKFPASSRWQKTTMHVVKLLDVSHAPFLWVMLRLSGDPKPRVTEIHRSGDNTWQPHFVPGKRLGFGTFILNKYEQKSLHGFGRSIFIALCLARGNSGQVQATQGFSAYHFLFQALTLVAECIVQGIVFTLFYRRKRGSAIFFWGWTLLMLAFILQSSGAVSGSQSLFMIFCKCGHLNMWERFGRHTHYSLFIWLHQLWWVTNPPFKGLNWGMFFFQTSLFENPMTSRGGGGWSEPARCAPWISPMVKMLVPWLWSSVDLFWCTSLKTKMTSWKIPPFEWVDVFPCWRWENCPVGHVSELRGVMKMSVYVFYTAKTSWKGANTWWMWMWWKILEDSPSWELTHHISLC